MQYSTATELKGHSVVDQDEWFKASQQFLAKEKEFTKARDELSRLRRELPWVKVEQNYTFETETGSKILSDLFGDKGQLIAYHFMFGPGWEEGCSGCSFVCDHFDSARQHFEHHDIAIVAVSRAPLAELLPFKYRMNWKFDWVSSFGSEFNYDFGASYRREDLDSGDVVYNFKSQRMNGEEQPGLTVFVKDEEGAIYRTYSSYERGLDLLCGAYNFIDLTPLGRHEKHPMDWMNLHDRY